jgi:hypothetical protein
MCSTRSGRRPALRPHAARHTDAALHAGACTESLCSRPSFLAARMRRPNRRGPRGRQPRLACGTRHAQHATAARVALLFECRHGRVGVAVTVHVVTSSMTSKKGRARIWKVRERRRKERREGKERGKRRTVVSVPCSSVLGCCLCDKIAKGA